jgi:hypothetical protein
MCFRTVDVEKVFHDPFIQNLDRNFSIFPAVFEDRIRIGSGFNGDPVSGSRRAKICLCAAFINLRGDEWNNSNSVIAMYLCLAAVIAYDKSKCRKLDHDKNVAFLKNR